MRVRITPDIDGIAVNTQKLSSSSRTPPKACATRQYPLSNHLWVNTERMSASVTPLSRNRSLDEMARDHAEKMAGAGKVLRRCCHDTSEIHENVLVGPSLQTVHKLTMCLDGPSKYNILNPSFTEFGMGTAKSGKNVFICQLFL